MTRLRLVLMQVVRGESSVVMGPSGSSSTVGDWCSRRRCPCPSLSSSSTGGGASEGVDNEG